jgi:hypothetical protein
MMGVDGKLYGTTSGAAPTPAALVWMSTASKTVVFQLDNAHPANGASPFLLVGAWAAMAFGVAWLGANGLGTLFKVKTNGTGSPS